MKLFKTSIIISSLFLIPVFCFGADLMLSPGKIAVPDKRPLKAGETVTLSPPFYVYATDMPSDTLFKISTSCYGDQKEFCPPPGYFIFNPSEFKLNGNGGQKVTATLNLPSTAQNGNYQALIIISPQLKSSMSENGAGASVGISVGSRLNFKIAGKLPVWKIALNWFNKNISTRLSSSVSSTGFDPKTTLLFAGILSGGLILLFFLKRVLKIFKKPVKVRQSPTKSVVYEDVIDLRNIRPKSENH